jgi:hypothetical protein
MGFGKSRAVTITSSEGSMPSVDLGVGDFGDAGLELGIPVERAIQIEMIRQFGGERGASPNGFAA